MGLERWRKGRMALPLLGTMPFAGFVFQTMYLPFVVVLHM